MKCVLAKWRNSLSFNGFSVYPLRFDRMNVFEPDEVSKDSLSVSSTVVHPRMQPEEIVAVIEKYGFVALRPYRWYSITEDTVEYTITDMLPEPFIEIADEKHLLITLYLGKRTGIADPANIRDIIRLTKRYPNTQWVLAHWARSFNPCFLEKAITPSIFLIATTQMTILLYEQLRALRRAVYGVGFNKIQVEDIFHDNAIGLVEKVK